MHIEGDMVAELQKLASPMVMLQFTDRAEGVITCNDNAVAMICMVSVPYSVHCLLCSPSSVDS